MSVPRRPAGLRAISVLVPLALLVATSCSGGSNGADLGAGGRRTTTTTPAFFPLTGLPVGGAAANATRPAATVKIENHPQARPQGGLDKADVVFEAVVEGGQTRFLAVFHSTDADSAGPVRSVRPSDPAIVAPFGGIVAYSGGIPRFVEAMKATGLTNLDETSGGDAFRRRRDKAAPHNLFTSTAGLYAKSSKGAAPPKFATFLAGEQAFAPAGATPVTHLTLAVAGSTTVDYDFDGGNKTWRRTLNGTAHIAEGGAVIAPTTVIVQFIPYAPTGEVDTTGSPVAEGKVVGSGDAVVFANGLMVRAKWSKTSASAVTTWTDANGAPLSLPPGRTWVELPAVGAAFTTR